jgi:hypothetical protein
MKMIVLNLMTENVLLFDQGKVPQLAQDLEKLEYFIRTTFYIY